MTIHPGSTELLSALSTIAEGLSVKVVSDGGDEAASFGTGPSRAGAELRADLPSGSLIASYDASDASLKDLASALLSMVVERERLESDMESMSMSSSRAMEREYQLVETLPQLSAGGDEAEIARLGVAACQRAGDVQRAVYLRYVQQKDWFEVVVDIASATVRRDSGEPESGFPANEGFLADVLSAPEGVVLRRARSGRLGEPGSIEHLAQFDLLGVPVASGAGDKRVVLGILVLMDKREASRHHDVPLDNQEVQVALSFAAMLGAVLGARKSAELGKEMTMARAIQRQILPSGPARLPGFDVAGEFRSCGAVGGDYFDFVPLADGRTMVVIADVSGHNLASGMMMVSARAMLRTLALVRSEPAQVFEDLAAAMYEDLTRTERFLTAAGVAVRPNEHSVDYVSAGHNDMFVYRAANDRVDRIATESTILGFLPRPSYAARRVELAPGDCLMLFTDGITETVDEAGNMFGDDRLAMLLAQLVPGRSARGILDGVLQEVDAFRRGQHGDDDITAVVIRCVGSGGNR